MARVRITVLKKAFYPDLAERYENPATEPCEMQIGQTFVSEAGECPVGMCRNAWESVGSFVRQLAAGGGKFFGDWMKNERSAMVSCNDGIRPATFYVEVIE